MQFKHPEILYFLALLILPILVHLFQLQKFIKVPFTNVAFLQKLILQTRKSSRIKKWLILATRLLLFTAIIFAFSQPYFSSKKVDQKQHTFIYLDNSLSTNTKGKKGNLLKIATQEIIENSSKKDNYSLLTHSDFYKNISSLELKNVLLNIKNEAKNTNLNDVILKINSQKTSKSKTSYKNILISDFQNTYTNEFTNVTQPISLIKLEANTQNNLAIDSVYINDTNSTNFTVQVIIKNQGEAKENIPIAIFNDQKLISKQSFSIEKDTHKKVSFIIQNQPLFLGEIQLDFEDTFSFDNSFYFTLNSNKKINILSIGKSANFLAKIYTKKEFNFSSSTAQNVNYNSILKQQLIILNEVEKIPSSLITSLVDFTKKGGHLVIIPNLQSDINSYNLLLKNLNTGNISPKKKDSLKITTIHFDHPLFKNVFSKKVQNFQYPITQNYFPSTFSKSSTIVSFENNSAFIKQVQLNNAKLYWVAAPLNKTNSNFTNSPLIVPIFYNFGQQSLQHSDLYYTVNTENTIEVSTSLEKDAVLNLKSSTSSFIPLQQTHQNKVTLTTKEQPLITGFQFITSKTDTLKAIAFNYPKEESQLQFLAIKSLTENNKNITIFNSVKDTFQEINKKNKVQWLWKWFLALAIVSLLLEILILKFFKP